MLHCIEPHHLGNDNCGFWQIKKQLRFHRLVFHINRMVSFSLYRFSFIYFLTINLNQVSSLTSLLHKNNKQKENENKIDIYIFEIILEACRMQYMSLGMHGVLVTNCYFLKYSILSNIDLMD